MRFTRIQSVVARIRPDTRGNVLMTLALSIVPLMLATGASIDYARAARLQTKLNAAADAAALAAVTQPMMLKSDSEAKTAAINMFNEQAKGLSGLIYDPADLTVTITTVAGAANDRTANVSYIAKSQNAFAGLLNMATVTIGGSSQANARIAPNIDFYILLDTSGSMALPATSAGLTLLSSKTSGCAFACHSTNDATAKDKSGKTTDYYGVAKSYGISLRSDEAKKAIQSMMTLAGSTSATNNAKYRAALSSFAAASTLANNSYKVLQTLTDDLSDVSTAAGSAPMSLYYKNSCPTASYCNNDTDTASSDAFDRMNKLMPAPGNGTNNAKDTPQEIMFVITDGMRDENRPGNRPEVAFDTTWCDTVKNRGIRIAILYTEYLPASLSDSWSKTNVAPYLYKVEPALKSCASDGLFYKVTTDDDISAALNKLFLTAVSTARLLQ